MTTRISTAMLHRQSLGTLQSRQAKLAHLQQQLATGQRLVTAKDDPVAAGAAVGLDRGLAKLDRYAFNANQVQNRLGLQENVLTHVGAAMTRVGELVLQATNPVLGDDSRRAIATEIESIRKQLLGLANSTDGSGRYLFGGTADGAAPFSSGTGGVSYHGDQTRRQVEVASDAFVLDALPGSEVFMRLRTGDGRVDGAAAPGNQGTAVLTEFGVTGTPVWNGGRYRIEFTSSDTYQVFDGNGAPAGGGSYAPGDSLLVGGLRLTLEGVPAAGDAFELGPAATRDVFATLQDLADTLRSAPTTAVEKAELQNRLQSALRDVTTAQHRIIDVRADGGAQLAALDSAAELRESHSVTLQTSLSQLRDLDWAEAISRYNLESTALQAAQMAYAQMQSLSLFNLMR